MLRLLFLSSTSLLLAACGDDACGPGDAPAFGIIASSADVSLTWGGLRAGQNNDCPDPSAPAGVISLTLQGHQQDNTDQLITLCIPRPDKLASGMIPLGAGSAQIIDLTGADANGCTYKLNSGRPITGTVSSSGLCDNGASKAGFAITVDGDVSLDRMCPTSNDTVAVAFQGTSAVTAE